MQKSRKDRRVTKHMKIRMHLQGTADVPRVTVFKSLHNFYAQLINDETHTTLAASSTKALSLTTNNIEAVKTVAKDFATKLKNKNVTKIVFDRSGYIYHGKVAAFAETLREEGINF
ncbi:50S ribosomal protein L18 [Mycoplasma zalophi]|uniref:Large ribosomal subunit protein uL18 n=1 Tax=Mycoplasma zalophi TaxID=191287 RepID=A0ABS6DQL1_9MOLU|nr:50S ribosomal protein L18 [Mycoplasma zalophi]MBU4691342.1 50S ribosomal protein L18 [Mycoplasma zalophi]MBU4692568.1 50S ribosomal protein L18 [Mycoplasma zalophi]MCU4117286.1 50S ribosomal protein L18 [Mycoplasma zalophi]